jgi:hypothetical protein
MIKWLFARAPLPMLALAAAYGVYMFQSIFVPHWVAFVSAAAFELTYVGLAVVETNDHRRARGIAIAAVAVSVVYNSLAALFERRAALLDATPFWLDAVLAVLHGLPLAIVAYNIADLLLHTTTVAASDTPPQVSVLEVTQLPATVRAYVRQRTQELRAADPTLSLGGLAAQLGTSPDTVRRALADSEVSKELGDLPADLPAITQRDTGSS